MNQPIVLCCASGGRSGQATIYLKSLGIDCENGGSWMAIKIKKKKMIKTLKNIFGFGDKEDYTA